MLASAVAPSGSKVSDGLQLRTMGLKDIRAMHNIFVHSVDDAFSYFPVEYRAKLRHQHNIPRLAKACISPRAHFFLLANNIQDIGYCLVRFQQARAYLFWMYVVPDFRGSGAGESLLQAAIQIARDRNKETLELVTHDKESFYAKYGFIPRRRVAGLVGGVDMVIMEYRI
ncbi:GNAT family N-acetyltransferase [bacterium]|nr:MAG: GNAT family N-acetyltransferase [bacterium]